MHADGRYCVPAGHIGPSHERVHKNLNRRTFLTARN